MTIDLSKRTRCHKLFSRLVWQELFNIYRARGGDLDNMGDMLCDLYFIERCFNEDNVHFWWACDGAFTETRFDFPPSENAVEVKRFLNKVSIQE